MVTCATGSALLRTERLSSRCSPTNGNHDSLFPEKGLRSGQLAEEPPSAFERRLFEKSRQFAQLSVNCSPLSCFLSEDRFSPLVTGSLKQPR